MNQRQESIRIPVVSAAKWTANGKFTVAACMARYMLCSSTCQTPLVFVDEPHVKLGMKEALEYGAKLSNDTDSWLEDVDLLSNLGLDKTLEIETISIDTTLSIVNTFLEKSQREPTACLLRYNVGNTLCIVGCGMLYYMFDLTNDLFVTVDNPEFDALIYGDEYGAPTPEAVYFLREMPLPAATAATATATATAEISNGEPPVPIENLPLQPAKKKRTTKKLTSTEDAPIKVN